MLYFWSKHFVYRNIHKDPISLSVCSMFINLKATSVYRCFINFAFCSLPHIIKSTVELPNCLINGLIFRHQTRCLTKTQTRGLTNGLMINVKYWDVYNELAVWIYENTCNICVCGCSETLVPPMDCVSGHLTSYNM